MGRDKRDDDICAFLTKDTRLRKREVSLQCARTTPRKTTKVFSKIAVATREYETKLLYNLPHPPTASGRLV